MNSMNRRQFLVSTTSATAIAIAGCAGADASSLRTPEEVSEAFVQAALDGDYDQATSLMTDEGAEELTESSVAESQALAERADIEIVNIESQQETENEAQVVVVIAGNTAMGAQTDEERIYLVKEDNVWLVNTFD